VSLKRPMNSQPPSTARFRPCTRPLGTRSEPYLPDQKALTSSLRGPDSCCSSERRNPCELTTYGVSRISLKRCQFICSGMLHFCTLFNSIKIRHFKSTGILNSRTLSISLKTGHFNPCRLHSYATPRHKSPGLIDFRTLGEGGRGRFVNQSAPKCPLPRSLPAPARPCSPVNFLDSTLESEHAVFASRQRTISP
jgi:hypothetical protein